MLLRVIDFETTGEIPEDRSDSENHPEVIEAAYADVYVEEREEKNPDDEGFTTLRTGRVVDTWQTLVRSSRDVSVEARAAHHIGDAAIAARGIGWEEALKALLGRNHVPDFFVAHNADFEQFFFDEEVGPWICTYKSALRLWPEAPRHSNQVLRYWLNHCDPGKRGMPPHRALPDCWVTSLILIRCIEEQHPAVLAQWTEEPKLFPVIPFGKHAGTRWPDIPADYLNWILRSDFEEDMKWNVRRELERRRNPEGARS